MRTYNVPKESHLLFQHFVTRKSSLISLLLHGFAIDVTAIARGIDICQSSRGRDGFAVRIILIACHHGAAAVYDAHHITLEVGDIVVDGAVVLQGIGGSISIVEEIQGVGAVGFPHQPATGVQIVVGNAVYGFTGAQPFQVVGVGHCGSGGYRLGQSSAVVPREGPPSTVVVAQRGAASPSL